MIKTDVFVWMEAEDGTAASLAVRALKQRLKTTVGQWFLIGTRGDRLEGLAHALGATPLSRPAALAGLPGLAASHGESPAVLLWSADAVLVADWTPWANSQVKLWPDAPAAYRSRGDLLTGTPNSWSELQEQSTMVRVPLPAGQVKVLASQEFEKATKGSSWPFGPSVVILEKPAYRR